MAAWLGASLGAGMALAACGGDVSTDPSGGGATTGTGSGTGGGGGTGTSSPGGAGAGGDPTTGAGGDPTTGAGGAAGGMPCQVDADCPAPPGPCASAACEGGVCSVVPASEETPCAGTCHCNGAGSCAGPGCISDAICPPSPSACLLSKCVGCEECALVAAPIGTLIQDSPGDCKLDICNGNGATTQVIADEDLPDDGDPCTVDLCDAGVPSHAPLCPPPQVCDQGVCAP